ncbi:unnamed protein product [Calypogeia fissa]
MQRTNRPGACPVAPFCCVLDWIGMLARRALRVGTGDCGSRYYRITADYEEEHRGYCGRNQSNSITRHRQEQQQQQQIIATIDTAGVQHIIPSGSAGLLRIFLLLLLLLRILLGFFGSGLAAGLIDSGLD